MGKEREMMKKDPCVYCGESTAFGYGRFVNRLPVDDGWGCAECSGFLCDKCGELIYLDEEITTETGDYHESCLIEIEKEESQNEKVL